jgi:sortase A
VIILDEQNTKSRKKVRRRPKPWMILMDSLIVILVVAGLYLVLRPVIIHLLQDNLTRQLEQAYDQGDGTIVIEPDYLEVPGEEVQYPEAVETSPTTAATGSTTTGSETAATSAETAPAKVTIRAIGRIIIPSIAVDMPVAEGATVYNLRVAIGHYSNSAGLGQEGNCILFGHRMYTYGRHFNRLGEMTVGQQIILEDKKNRYTYEVDEIDTILPEELLDIMYTPVEGSRVMLVTCTPIRVASHRLLVKGKLISTEPLQ